MLCLTNFIWEYIRSFTFIIQREDEKYHSCHEVRKTGVSPLLDCQVLFGNNHLQIKEEYFVGRWSVWFIKEKGWRENLDSRAFVSFSPTMLRTTLAWSTLARRTRQIITQLETRMRTSRPTFRCPADKTCHLSPFWENLRTRKILDKWTLSD